MTTIEPPVERDDPGVVPPTPVPETVAYALRAGRLFDGREARGPGAVLVERGRIVGVRPATDPSVTDVPVVDLGDDVTLLPGLVDPHVHLAFDASADVVEYVRRVPDDALMVGMRARARRALAAGITTMRDLGDRRYLSLSLRDELATRFDAGPRLLCAGPPITTPGGHCWFLGGAVASHADLRAAVAERAARGVDAVKVMVTGGELTPGSHAGVLQYDLADLTVIVDEASRHGLPVAAHAHAPTGIATALAAGVHSIEHCSFMTDDDVVPDDDLIEAIAACGVIVSVTVGMAPGDLGPLPPRILARLPKFGDLIRRVVAAGATVTVGTDAGIGPPKPHDVLPYGAVALADLTGDAGAALAAVTSVAAASCGVADRKGTLAVGQDADVLAVRGDPVADIRTLHDVVAVYRAGVRVRGERGSAPPTGPIR